MLRTKVVRPEVKVIDAQAGKVEATVSTEARDRDGDIIRQAGWELDNFNAHPVLMSSHDYYSLRSQIGEWEDMSVRDKKMVGTARYYIGEGNEEADWGFKLASKGRAAYSVGFIPDMSAAKEIEKGGLEFNKQELLEVSHVAIPSNPQALQHMKQKNLHPAVGELVAEMLEEVKEETGNVDKLAEKLWERMKVYLDKRGIYVVRHDHDSDDIKRAVPSHSTPTVERVWEGIPTELDVSPLKLFSAWIDPDDNTMHCVHHDKEGNANIHACKAAIEALNTNADWLGKSESDRQGVYNHLARHIKDAGQEPPELVSPETDWGISDLLKEVSFEEVINQW